MKWQVASLHCGMMLGCGNKIILKNTVDLEIWFVRTSLNMFFLTLLVNIICSELSKTVKRLG